MVNWSVYTALCFMFIGLLKSELESYSCLTRIFRERTSSFGVLSRFARAQNLRHGIVIKTSFKPRVTRMGLGSFGNINIFLMKYYVLQFV